MRISSMGVQYLWNYGIDGAGLEGEGGGGLEGEDGEGSKQAKSEGDL